MKTLAIVTVVGALASPALAFAQGSSSVTRPEVQTDLQQLEQAGYSPSAGSNAHYPDDVQAAEARVSAQGDDRYATNAMGGVTAGASASGGPMPMHRTYRTYDSDTSNTSNGCTGPQSFCNVYFGK